MATRSIKLKIALGRGEQLRHERQAIWTTHELFNQGVHYYMTWLMRLRQQPLDDPDAPNDDILPYARDAQRSNGKDDLPGSDEEVRTLLRRLYEELVPSAVGKSGGASQTGRDYLSLLVDPHSIGGLGLSKSGRRPGWQSMPEGPEREAKRQAWAKRREESLEQGVRQPLKELGILPLFQPFSKTVRNWTRDVPRSRKKSMLPSWDRDMFQQALERLMSWEAWNRRVKTEFENKQERFKALCSRHLDPECRWHQKLRQYEEERKIRLDEVALSSERSFRITRRMIRGWDQLHERWLQVAPSERTEAHLRSIVAEMQKELRGRFGDASDFYLWLAKPENHFLWDETGIRGAIRIHVAINEAEQAIEEAKEFANYTPPDALLHPLWARSDLPGGSNMHKYRLSYDNGRLQATVRLLAQDDQGQIIERDHTLPLRPSGQWDRPHRGSEPPVQIVDYDSVPKAWRTGEKNEPKRTWVRVFDVGTTTVLYGTLGQARLQLERDDFRVRSGDPTLLDQRRAAFRAGNRFPRAYLNITLNLSDRPKPKVLSALVISNPDLETEPKMVADYRLATNTRARSQTATLHDIAKDASSPQETLRVMSVDLGLRKFASCSVFELVNRRHANKFAIPVHGADGLFMQHCRSFTIALSGEEESAEQRKQRASIRAERLILRSALRRLSRLLSLGRHDDPATRKEEWEALLRASEWDNDAQRSAVDRILDPTLLQRLTALFEKPIDADPSWPDEVLRVHREWEHALGQAIHEWRRRGRSRHTDRASRGYGGLSFWHIDELEQTRRLLNAWSCHSRDYETLSNGSRRPLIVRSRQRFSQSAAPRDQDRDTDITLLRHINNLKEDRLKVGADRLVNAALGFEYEGPEKGWVQRHAPCQVILFEDLSRYLFKNDRPRQENSMLMKWGHREIPRTVAMQGEIHGLAVGRVAAEFTSQFRASGRLLTPGIRCHRLTSNEINQPWFKREIQRLKETDPNAPIPAAGQMIPMEGGEWFVTLNEDGTLYQVNADINAAQNIMRRFWTRYSEVIRITCRRLTDNSWGPKTLGKRLSRAVAAELNSKAFVLRPMGDPHDSFWRWVPVNRRAAGLSRSGPEQTDADADEIDAADEEVAQARGEIANFFRDPSGIVIPYVNGEAPWIPAKDFWSRVRTVIGSKLSKVQTPDSADDDFPY